jgi:hypothetical protein
MRPSRPHDDWPRLAESGTSTFERRSAGGGRSSFARAGGAEVLSVIKSVINSSTDQTADGLLWGPALAVECDSPRAGDEARKVLGR